MLTHNYSGSTLKFNFTEKSQPLVCLNGSLVRWEGYIIVGRSNDLISTGGCGFGLNLRQ